MIKAGNDDNMVASKNKIIDLVKQINSGESEVIREMTVVILDDIFSYKEIYELLSMLYSIIFLTRDLTSVGQLLNGFIEFSHSKTGYQYKPMIDFLLIEAFNTLVERVGWSIVKPCIMTMSAHFPKAEYEPLFNHIVERIVNQIDADLKENPYYNSNLCYNLPREKSRTWGWFARYIAWAYFPNIYTTSITAKQMRTRLMYYRRLITRLRRNVAVTFVREGTIDADKPIAEDWNGLLAANVKSDKYGGAQDILTRVWPKYEVEESASACATACASACEAVAEAVAVAACEAVAACASETAAVEASACEAVAAVAASACEAVAEVAASASETAAEESEIKNIPLNTEVLIEGGPGTYPTETPSSWRSWLGWS